MIITQVSTCHWLAPTSLVIVGLARGSSRTRYCYIHATRAAHILKSHSHQIRARSHSLDPHSTHGFLYQQLLNQHNKRFRWPSWYRVIDYSLTTISNLPSTFSNNNIIPILQLLLDALDDVNAFKASLWSVWWRIIFLSNQTWLQIISLGLPLPTSCLITIALVNRLNGEKWKCKLYYT